MSSSITSPYLGSTTSNISFFSLFYSFFCLFCLFPQFDTHSSLRSPLTVFSIKKCWYLFLLGLAFFLTSNPPPNTYNIWGDKGRGKRSPSLCVYTSVSSASSFSNLNLPNVAGREQNTELCGTDCWPTLASGTSCMWGPRNKNCSHSCILLLRNQDRPPAAMSLTGMMWVVLFPDRDTWQNSVLHLCPGDKIHLQCFSDRAPLQQIWGNTNWLAKKLISKTRNRFFWITKGNKMRPFISMFSMNGKAE